MYKSSVVSWNVFSIVLKDTGSLPFTRESRLLNRKFTLTMNFGCASENEIYFFRICSDPFYFSLHPRHCLHQQVPITSFQVMEYNREEHHFCIQFKLENPSVFPVTWQWSFTESLWYFTSKDCAEQTCLLFDCNPLVKVVSRFSLSWRASEFHFSHCLALASSLTLAALSACVVVVHRL